MTRHFAVAVAALLVGALSGGGDTGLIQTAYRVTPDMLAVIHLKDGLVDRVEDRGCVSHGHVAEEDS